MTREEYLLTLLWFAANREDFDPSECGFAVATETYGRNGSWFPFERGEVIVRYGEDGREPFGEGRQPDKWSVHFEWFGRDLEAAKRRSAEVTGA